MKKILLLAAAAVFALSFTSCDGSKDEDGNYGSYTYDGIKRDIKSAVANISSDGTDGYIEFSVYPEVVTENNEPSEEISIDLLTSQLGNTVVITEAPYYYALLNGNKYSGSEGAIHATGGNVILNQDGTKFTLDFNITFEDGKKLVGNFNGIPVINYDSKAVED